MTIYAASGDGNDFVMTVGTGPTTTTTAAHRNSAYVSQGVFFATGAQEGYLPLSTAVTDLWIHMYVGTNSAGVNGNNNTVLYELRSTTTPGYRLRLDNTTGVTVPRWAFQKTTNSGTSWTDIVTWPYPYTAGQRSSYIDIHLVINASTGTVDAYDGDVLKASFTGDTSSSAASINRMQVGTTSQVVALVMSEIVIASESTIGWHVFPTYPNAAGTYTEFTGAFTDVDELNLSLTDFILSNTANQRFTANSTDLTTTILGTHEVKGLVTTAFTAITSDSTPNDIQHFLRTNSSDFTSASKTVPKTNTQTITREVYDTNPATSAKFTQVEAAAVQFGVKSVT